MLKKKKNKKRTIIANKLKLCSISRFTVVYFGKLALFMVNVENSTGFKLC